MLSREEVNELIITPKIPKNGSTLLYDQNKLKNGYELISQADNNQRFKLDYNESKNVSLKLTCHTRDFGNLALLRICFQGTGHNNPQTITTTVPNFLHNYVGYEISPRTAHIHIYVEGSELDWAIPLDDYLSLDLADKLNFQIREINSQTDKANAIQDFIKIINLQASISFLGKLSLN